MGNLSKTEQEKQALYRDARFTNKYDGIWQSVNKCVFCELNEKYVFFEENNIVMTISLYAYIDGHFMIIPRRHVRSTKELSEVEWQTIRKFTYIAKKLIRDVHNVKGMQLVQKDGVDAQSTVEHLHFHCVPFDSPDLSVWNYRKLLHTPLENVALYKDARKKIISASQKFSKKYQHTASLPIVCDLVLLNTKGEILLQKRKSTMRLVPDYLTLPGGHVSDFSRSLEEELAREIKEEIGFEFNRSNIQLIHSGISNVRYARHATSLDSDYEEESKFMWNVYLLPQVDPAEDFVAGDDCESVVWISMDDIANRSDISDGTKKIIARINNG